MIERSNKIFQSFRASRSASHFWVKIHGDVYVRIFSCYINHLHVFGQSEKKINFEKAVHDRAKLFVLLCT